MESNEGEQKEEDEQDEDEIDFNKQPEVKVVEKKEVDTQEKEKPMMSDVESSIDEVIRMRFSIEKDTILKGRKNKLEDFDRKIRELNVQKAKLDVELKYSENKLYTYFKEMMILEGLQSEDNRFSQIFDDILADAE